MLPAKKMFGHTADFIASRQGELEQWMYKLVEYHQNYSGTVDPLATDAMIRFLSERKNEPPARAETSSSGEQHQKIDEAAAASALPIGDAVDADEGGRTSSDMAPPPPPPGGSMSSMEGSGGAGTTSVTHTGTGAGGGAAAPGAARASLEDFELLRVIGKGSFGKVFLVRKISDQEVYAMKVLKKDHVRRRKQIEHTRTERRVLGTVRHPFIVGMHYAFQSPQKL